MDVSAYTTRHCKHQLERMDELIFSALQGLPADFVSDLKAWIHPAGDRVHATITLLAGELLGVRSEALPALAASIEILSIAARVHGVLAGETIPAFRNRPPGSGGSPSSAVLMGDFLFAVSSQLAATTDSIEAMRLTSRTLRVITNGYMNRMFPHGQSEFKEYFDHAHAKTAVLFEAAAQAPALLHPAGLEHEQPLREFGYHLGMARHICQDVMRFSSAATQAGGQGNALSLPLLYWHAWNNNGYTQNFCRTGALQDADAPAFCPAVASPGDCVERALADAADYIKRAETGLLGFPDNPARSALLGLARRLAGDKIPGAEQVSGGPPPVDPAWDEGKLYADGSAGCRLNRPLSSHWKP